jgi:hypothetical protein
VIFREQLFELLNNADKSVLNEFFSQELERFDYNDDLTNEFLDELQACSFYTQVEEHGGEGEGEDFYRIYSFCNGNEELFVKFDGSYQSYRGSEYDDWYFVTPKSVTVTEYFRA